MRSPRNVSLGNSRHSTPTPPRQVRGHQYWIGLSASPGSAECLWWQTVQDGIQAEWKEEGRKRIEGRGKVLPWFWPSWATRVLLSRLACLDHCVSGHTGPCPSEQTESDRCFWFLRYLFCFTKRGDACPFSDPLRLLPLQSVRVRCEEAGQCHRQRVPPVCGARSGAACQCHCELRIEGHDRIPEEDLMPFHPWLGALRWLRWRKALWEGESLFSSNAWTLSFPRRKAEDVYLHFVCKSSAFSLKMPLT